MPRNITDELFNECKALSLSNGVPFQAGGFGGSGPIYSSMNAWDSVLDSGLGSIQEINYEAKLGDLSRSSLVMAAYRFLSNVLPEARLEVKEGEGVGGSSEVVPNHPAVNLWNRPNKFYSGSTLKKAISFSWVLRSEAYILKTMNKGGTQPTELWYEPHWTIRPAWPMDGSEFISHYEINRNGQWLPIPVENVIHLRGLYGLIPSRK